MSEAALRVSCCGILQRRVRNEKLGSCARVEGSWVKLLQSFELSIVMLNWEWSVLSLRACLSPLGRCLVLACSAVALEMEGQCLDFPFLKHFIRHLL